MIKATGMMDGRPLLILGLTEDNLEALPQDYPILVQTEQMGLPAMTVLLLGGKSDADIAKQITRVTGTPPPPPIDLRTGRVAELDQERARYKEVIDDLWSCIAEIDQLQPETVERCQQIHEELHHV